MGYEMIKSKLCSMIRHACQVCIPLLVLQSAEATETNSLCQVGEKESFSCNIGAKIVSVCSPDSVGLVYRYGKPNSVEIELESEVHFSATSYSGGGEGRLTFKNGRYHYVVYSGITNGEWLENGAREKIEYAGILVAKNSEEVANLKCTGFQDKKFIHYLPPYIMEEFTYY